MIGNDTASKVARRHGFLERHEGRRNGFQTKKDAADVESAHGQPKPPALLADPITFRYLNILQEQRAPDNGIASEILIGLRGHAGKITGNDKTTDPLGIMAGCGPGKHQREIGIHNRRDAGFLPV